MGRNSGYLPWFFLEFSPLAWPTDVVLRLGNMMTTMMKWYVDEW